MTVLIKNPETDALVRRLAKQRGTGLTETVHIAVQNELKRESEPSAYIIRAMDFVRRLHEQYPPELGQPVDKAFIDSLYEDD